MLTTMKPLKRELSGDLFFHIKEDPDTRGIPKYCLKCENMANVTEMKKENK